MCLGASYGLVSMSPGENDVSVYMVVAREDPSILKLTNILQIIPGILVSYD